MVCRSGKVCELEGIGKRVGCGWAILVVHGLVEHG
jgi:hypothetical protein